MANHHFVSSRILDWRNPSLVTRYSIARDTLCVALCIAAGILGGCNAASEPENCPGMVAPDEVAGGSAGCGNPGLAALDPTEVNSPCYRGGKNCDGWNAGQLSPVGYSVCLGEELKISFYFADPLLKIDVVSEIELYAGRQNPHLDSLPLAVFHPAARDSFRLTKNDLNTLLSKAEFAIPSEGETVIPFNLRIRMWIKTAAFDFPPRSALLQGIGFAPDRERFLFSDGNPLAHDTLYLNESTSAFKGVLNLEEGNTAVPDLGPPAFHGVFIPGSPFKCQVNPDSGKIKMDSLPGGKYELRIFTMPKTRKAGTAVPIFLLKADQDTTAGRRFFRGKAVDTLFLP